MASGQGNARSWRGRAGVVLLILGVPLMAIPQDRVGPAQKRALPTLRAAFKKAKVSYPPGAIFLRAFKEERVLELWASEKTGDQMTLIKSYPVAGQSGTLGPKRREGDKQVPEGVYFVDRFNPQSRFHLSLGINYPNASDRVRSDRQRPGGDIFIHGDNKSIGCLAITDPLIEEVYTVALAVRRKGPIPVHIFPARLTEAKRKSLSRVHPQHASLWAELAPIYQAFEKEKRVPRVVIDKSGAYRLAPVKSG